MKATYQKLLCAGALTGCLAVGVTAPAWANAVGQVGPYIATTSGVSSLWKPQAVTDPSLGFEPQALALLGAGLLLLGLARRRT